MKKCLIAVVLFSTLCAGCGRRENGISDTGNFSEIMEKEGIAPYELSEEEQFLLEAFGMTSDQSGIYTFRAPKEAKTLYINVYRLKADNTWELTGNGGISLGAEGVTAEPVSGTLTMELQEEYSIEFHVNCRGGYSFTSDTIVLDEKQMAGVKGRLEDFQNIEINKEIPLAVMVYDSGSSMRSYSPDDYFDPSVFDGMDLVQIVAVEFSSEEF